MSRVEPQRYFSGLANHAARIAEFGQRIGPQPILPADAYRIAP